eukprot:31499-Pelagococcus_subviridis.AAC.46
MTSRQVDRSGRRRARGRRPRRFPSRERRTSRGKNQNSLPSALDVASVARRPSRRSLNARAPHARRTRPRLFRPAPRPPPRPRRRRHDRRRREEGHHDQRQAASEVSQRPRAADAVPARAPQGLRREAHAREVLAERHDQGTEGADRECAPPPRRSLARRTRCGATRRDATRDALVPPSRFPPSVDATSLPRLTSPPRLLRPTPAPSPRAEERGSPVQYVKRGGTPTGVILSDDATLESLGLDYDMSVYEHLWEDSDENQEKFVVDREKVREMVGMFMMEHPDIGRHGPEVTGEAEDPKDWTAKNLKKRENMEKEVQKERERKQKRREEEAAKATAAAKAAKEGKPVAA